MCVVSVTARCREPWGCGPVPGAAPERAWGLGKGRDLRYGSRTVPRAGDSREARFGAPRTGEVAGWPAGRARAPPRLPPPSVRVQAVGPGAQLALESRLGGHHLPLRRRAGHGPEDRELEGVTAAGRAVGHSGRTCGAGVAAPRPRPCPLSSWPRTPRRIWNRPLSGELD